MCDQRAADLFAEAVGEGGPTRQQAAVLYTLQRHPSSSQSRIAQLTGIDRNTLAEMLPRLIRKGLVGRRRSKQDARAYEHSLLPAGEAAFLAALPKIVAAQAKILEPLPEELRAVFLECLQRVAGLFKEELVEP